MSEECESEEEPTVSPFIRKLVKVTLGIFLFLFMVGVLFRPGRLEIMNALLGGWYRFMARTLPRVTWNWDLIGMGVIGTALILAGTHYFLNWLYARRSHPLDVPPDGEPARWPWRRTWCGVGAVGLMFLTGSAVVGTVHQIGWIRASSDSMIEAQGSGRSIHRGMEQIEEGIQTAMLETKNQLEPARRLLWDKEQGILQQDPWLWETFHVLVIESPDQPFMGLLIFPRDAQNRSRLGGLYHFGGSREFVPAERIPEVIDRHRHELKTI